MFILHKNRIFIFLLFFLISNLYSQDIKLLYPEEYKNALELKQQYELILQSKGIIDTGFYISLVFPEMIRYNTIRDELETFINKVAYTTIDKYEGCSIGAFQIKPNCALEIENNIKSSRSLSEKYPLLAKISNEENITEKIKRINRLREKKYQIEYLLAFVDICINKYDLQKKPIEEQLKVISAAYNIGFLKSLDDYKKFQNTKSFPYGSGSPDSLWNYTELVLDFYSQFKED